MSDVQGRRIHPIDTTCPFAEGDYGQIQEGPRAGRWMCRPPGSHLGDLDQHEVEEHDDGTITVTPSILISGDYYGDHGYHGWLTKGKWVAA